MPSDCTYLPYSDTGYFSQLVLDYLAGDKKLDGFYTYATNAKGYADAIAARSKYPIDRKALVGTLQKQYANLPQHEAVTNNIAALANENTFTVCTAHQPNLLTGYLYFIYKIAHAIKLAEELKAAHPGKNFVPVYYIGSEDNDLDELGTFRYEGKKYVWDAAGQTGAVGRMKTTSLKPLLEDLFKVLGPPGKNLDQLKKLLTEAYLKHDNIADATQYLVNDLFGKYGLIVINPDEAIFKKGIAHIIKDDLLHQSAHPLVVAQMEKLEQHYKAQAYPRPINLFYLIDGLRERIEQQGDKWVVVNSDISFTKDELLAELDNHPERFSPNVITRGLLQETMLPDVAFIGGGAEVAYWLQLKPVFDHYKVFYPVIVLRQSALWLNEAQQKQLQQLNLGIADAFKPELELVKAYIDTHTGKQYQTSQETTEIEKVFASLKQKAVSLDPTLRSSAEAALTKMKYQLEVLEKKMLRAEKRKMQTELQRLSRMKSSIFPNNSLQERTDNFMAWFLQYGYDYIGILKDAIQSDKQQFLVIND